LLGHGIILGKEVGDRSSPSIMLMQNSGSKEVPFRGRLVISTFIPPHTPKKRISSGAVKRME
jgi:hypothetical protein